MKREREVTGGVGSDEVETYEFCYQPLSQRLADSFCKGTDRDNLKLGRSHGPVRIQLGHCIVKTAVDNM